MWKVLGLAGLVGAAAVGVAAGTATVRRRRRQFVDADPAELRARLHARHDEALERAAD